MAPLNTPPASPSIPIRDDEDELFEEDVLEEVPIDDDNPPVEDENEDEEDGMSEDEMVELPGGIDQLESIIEDHNKPEDNSKLIFSKHEKSVFCVSFHPEVADLVVSGGEDDLAYIWNSKSGEVLHKVDGWQDSVHCAEWSADGQHLALCDMSGKVKVLKYPGFAEAWSFEVGDILWLRWHIVANVLFAGTADSEMWMWKIPSGVSKLFGGPGEKTECGALLADGKKFVTGYTDGSIRIFDLKKGEAEHTIKRGQGAGHLDTINSLACHMNNSLICSGSMDGTAKLWNPTSGKCVGTLLCGSTQEENSSSSIECCAFPDDKSTTLCVTGSLDGVVRVWDTPTQITRSQCKVGEGVTKVMVHPVDPLVFAGTLDGAVRCLDLRSGTSVTEFSGHTGSVLDFRVSPDCGQLVTSADDGTCRIFDLRAATSSS